MKKIASLLLILSLLLTGCSGFSGKGDTSDRKTSPKSGNKPGPSNPAATTTLPDDGYPDIPAPSDGNPSMLAFDAGKSLTAEEIADCVTRYTPDFFTLSGPSGDLLDALTPLTQGYTRIGEPNTEGGRYQAIFYRDQTLETVKSATIWLTGTPAEPSKWEGAEDFDICTYALFEQKESGKRFAVFQADLCENPDARTEEIVCLYAKYACYKDYFPTLLLGDLSGGDNSVLTAGGGLALLGENLYSACLTAENLTRIGKKGQEYAVCGHLSLGDTPYTVDLTKNLVALTFDDGPRIDNEEHAYTEAILKIMAEHGKKCTFFLVGNRLTNSAQADLVRQEFAAGHEIGNHTYDHTSYSELTANELMANLEKTDALVRQLTGGIPTLVYRAPGGSNKTAAPLKRPLVNWSVDTEDWSSKATPDTVFATLKKQIYSGGIVLMHDLHRRSPDILDTVLDWLDENGYQPVTVSELFEFSDIQMDSNHAYYSTRSIKAR